MNRSPLKAIRLHCLGCSGTSNEVKLCTVTDCPLYTFRLGHRPAKGEETLEPARTGRALSSDHLAKLQEGRRLRRIAGTSLHGGAHHPEQSTEIRGL